MKSFFIILSLVLATNAFSAEKKKVTLNYKTKILKIMLMKEKTYKLELSEYAAAYYADESLLPCLQRSMSENKEVELIVDPKKMVVVKCN